MQFSSRITLALVGLVSMVAARPVICTEKTLDGILLGHMPKNACCSYGSCVGDVNVSGG
ncbi:hypothetical protein VC83_06356 [Pseudogymnoascus destructans]|uniref:Hydrophobin n=2 Tax=Pseudogymnoascus destructans TaxID=655981 RepID=L8GAM8_PSED2|nr:uncharacterized protein VC83_06356 [Pseudogymnoascus destructans]ELR09954.1 hypothetical protein GMDG_00712 [Pseudogymnoascus destructans 20631-21]OAF58287.1 hypothetical protein VC83_06356 [Pseudogymnoascus destructans]